MSKYKNISHEFGEGKECRIIYNDDMVIIEFHRSLMEGEKPPKKLRKGQCAGTILSKDGKAFTVLGISHEAADVLCSGLLKMIAIKEGGQPRICPLCDGVGRRVFPNCNPPIDKTCEGCEGLGILQTINEKIQRERDKSS